MSKVGCIGNMNNNFFALVRYLRDLGIDAELLILEYEPIHFHPSCDSFDLSYRSYTHLLDWGDMRRFLETSPTQVLRDLAPYEVLIGCGTSPAYVERCGRRLDAFIPYGADLYEYPFLDLRIRKPRPFASRFAVTKRQRRGILRAEHVVEVDYENDQIGLLSKLGYKGKRLPINIPMLYAPIYDPAAIDSFANRTHWHHEFRRVRERSELMVVHHARQIWSSPPNRYSSKGNDKLIRGFAAFCADRPDVEACLVMVEYGVNLPDSKNLVRELGIEERVEWFPLMNRKDLMVGLAMADLGAGEFSIGWFGGGVIYENLALAKPLLHFRRDASHVSQHSALYPLINVSTPEEIRAALHDFVARPSHFLQMGKEGRDWFLEHAVKRPVQALADIALRRVPS